MNVGKEKNQILTRISIENHPKEQKLKVDASSPGESLKDGGSGQGGHPQCLALVNLDGQEGGEKGEGQHLGGKVVHHGGMSTKENVATCQVQQEVGEGEVNSSGGANSHMREKTPPVEEGKQMEIDENMGMSRESDVPVNHGGGVTNTPTLMLQEHEFQPQETKQDKGMIPGKKQGTFKR